MEEYMKKILNYVWVFVILLCCATGCFIQDETETDLVLSFGVDEIFDFNVNGTFDKTTLITRTQIIVDADIPQDATVKKVDIEYIAAKIEPLTENTPTQAITLNALYGDQPLFVNKNIGFHPDMEVIDGLDPDAVKAFRAQLLNYFDNDYSNDDDIIFNLNGNTNPPNDTLKIRVKIRLQGAVTLSTELL
jgi:hypothetical protein